MRLLTGVPGWEAEVLVPPRHPELLVVRRCLDLEDLLVTAATGAADAALVSSELPRLDGDALARLRALGLAVVGLTPPGDEAAERRLRQLGLEHVLPSGGGIDAVEAALADAVRAAAAARDAGAGFAHALSAHAPPREGVPADPVEPRGRVVAVWGPTGAPGRTTVATGLAAELAELGWPTLLVDADPYGGAVALAVGVDPEASSLAAACRQANLGTLDLAALDELVVELGARLGVLTGLDRPDRWPELRPAALEAVLALARTRAAVTVVDCGFCLEQDEELSYDTLAPRRNGATLTVLDQADLVVVVGAPGPLGLQRLLLGLADLREVVLDARAVVVLNRVRGTGVQGEARDVLRRHAGVEQVTAVPLDVAAVDLAHAKGLPLTQAAPSSPARQALAGLARSLVGSR